MFQHVILFHRRLIVLAVTLVCILGVLLVQTAHLTIVQGVERFEQAQARLHTTTYLPTWRGSIIDRMGRVIAEDVASYDIAIDWDVISGERFEEFARKDAIESVGKKVWNSMSPEDSERLISTYLPLRLEELDQFWHAVARLGEIEFEELTHRLDLIRSDVEKTANAVWKRQEAEHKRKYKDSQFEKQPIREHREAHVVLPRVTDHQAMQFSLWSESLDAAISVQHARQRDYPYRHQSVLVERSELPSPLRKYDSIEVGLNGVAELLVGSVRGDTWVEDIQGRPFKPKNKPVDLGGYRIGDEVGNRGLEYSLESDLRGYRGSVRFHRSGEELQRTQPVGGKDAIVTIDIALQARLEAIFSQDLGLMQVQPWHGNTILPNGTPLRGALVVLDVATSDVLAMVSTPAIGSEVDAEGYPWLNRAAEGLYPPGSIIKPLVLAAAMTDGVLGHDDAIECTGYYFEHVKNAARCWTYTASSGYSTHGKLKAVQALARSCNIFFYELGTRLGFDSLVQWLQRFGMSQPVSAQLTHADAQGTQGHLPSPEEIQLLRDRGAIAFETVSISIGQGALTWSPLHAAAAYATLARGGIWRSPRLVQGNSQNTYSLHLNQEGVRMALEGMRESVTKSYGTGARLKINSKKEPTFNIEGVKIWGKTGTAEAPPYRIDNVTKTIPNGRHAWFVVLASSLGKSTPDIVLVVLVEHGGSGGLVAGPIANQALHALASEGYFK